MSKDSEEPVRYEIVEFPDGDIGLCRAGGSAAESEPLVTIRFSEESRYFLEKALHNGAINVAKAMVEAGLDVIQDLQDEADPTDESEPVPHLVH